MADAIAVSVSTTSCSTTPGPLHDSVVFSFVACKGMMHASGLLLGDAMK